MSGIEAPYNGGANLPEGTEGDYLVFIDGQWTPQPAPAGGAVEVTRWLPLPLNNGATDDGGATSTDDHFLCYRRVGDEVQVRGRITKLGSNPTVAYATLPSGFHPVKREIFSVANGGGLNGTVTVLATGEIMFSTMPAWLGGIRFSITPDDTDPTQWG